ncbi:uncharacterized protein ColSpa_08280 [Colletotrichum spaethianum]|uniref:2EXR domain-containing protein n=1 Tax=Colletotrichum spaethianum TaxID=700344 RepID=A0AA37P9G7_9PEZI|nr:uncharacterized protein ColSpa_08280 [Colletotrichum spaethianum]GKT48099.1 hypothetical protein ColSpa_08280 [Colletotrichum spaethianum]
MAPVLSQSLVSLAGKIARIKARVKKLEDEISAEKPKSEDGASATKTFPKFRQLPVEIRRAIWEASLPASRVFEPTGDDEELFSYKEGKPTRFIREWAPPRMRGACREAYAVCMSVGRFTFGCFKNSRIRGLWFNDKHDAVYFSHYWQWDYTRVCGVQTIYLSPKIALTELVHKNCWDANLAACRRLVVALHPGMLSPAAEVTPEDLPGTKPVFRAMTDDDIIGPHQLKAASFPEFADKEFITWGELRLVLQNLRQKMITANAEKPDFYKGPIQMEAVEVFRALDDRR